MERETGVEPATSTLARLHSTTELFPPAAGMAGRGTILPGGSGECQEEGGRHLADFEGVADEPHAGRSPRRLEDLHHVEPAGAVGRPQARQVVRGRDRDAGALAAVHRFAGAPEQERRARLHLHEHQHVAILGDEVDLRGPRPVAALQDPVAGGHQVALGRLLAAPPEADVTAGGPYVRLPFLGQTKWGGAHGSSRGYLRFQRTPCGVSSRMMPRRSRSSRIRSAAAKSFWVRAFARLAMSASISASRAARWPGRIPKIVSKALITSRVASRSFLPNAPASTAECVSRTKSNRCPRAPAVFRSASSASVMPRSASRALATSSPPSRVRPDSTASSRRARSSSRPRAAAAWLSPSNVKLSGLR